MKKVVYLLVLMFCFALVNVAIAADFLASMQQKQSQNVQTTVNTPPNVPPMPIPIQPITLSNHNPALSAPPAWAKEAYKEQVVSGIQPFGFNLFQGNFTNTINNGMNSDYVLGAGDRIAIRIWGAKTYDDILTVDQQGNILLPEIGPLNVAGTRYGQLQQLVKNKVGQVFTSNVDVYTNLMNTQPISVFVTGFVNKPGRYAGSQGDSIFYFIDKACGINAERGSYRSVKIMRNQSEIANFDLYDFMLRGGVKDIKLKDGDVIFITEKGISVTATGQIRQNAKYEFKQNGFNGSDLVEFASPYNSVSHVSISGIREEQPINVYLSMNEFKKFILADNDSVEFHADKIGTTIMINAAGAIEGASKYPVKKNATLKELLANIKIDNTIANLDSVYITRKSVVQQQKKTISDSLRRLEQFSLTATSSSVDEANIRVREAELIQNFVDRASKIEPDGVVVVSRKGKLNDMPLEDGDTIVIPQKTNIVQITGEVLLPKAVAWDSKMSINDYIINAGGFSDRADKTHILIVKSNGEVLKSSEAKIEAGDNVLVMPRYDTKNMQVAKDIMQVLYQIAVSAKIAVGL